jgi:hypothetical protein
MKSRLTAQFVVGWVLLLMVIMTGCGQSTTAAGTVTYHGRPVTYGSVIFVGADKVAHAGVIATDGAYTVEGLLPGSYSIAVVSRDPSRGRSILRGHKPESSGRAGPTGKTVSNNGWFPLPANLESSATSGLTAMLSAGRVKYDIELK